MESLNDIKNRYDLDLEKVIETINSNKFQKVVLQFPDGLKEFSGKIADYLKEKTGAEFFIWLGSCYGACDYPIHLNNLKKEESIDLVVQFGHNELMPDY